jgi:excinuclease ABC subunit A
MKRFRGRSVSVLAPVVRGRKGLYKDLIRAGEETGCPGVRIDGKLYRYGRRTPPPSSLARHAEHDIDFLIGRARVSTGNRREIAKLIERALKVGRGSLSMMARGKEDVVFSSARSCAGCGRGFDELDPRFFSFNSRRGACPSCEGLGYRERFCESLLVPDEEKSLAQGALAVYGGSIFARGTRARLEDICVRMGIPWDLPFKKLTRARRDRLFHGQAGVFDGVVPHLEKMREQTGDDKLADYLSQFRREFVCRDCGGGRLKPEFTAVLVEGRSIADYHRMSVEDALRVFSTIEFSGREKEIGGEIVKEIAARLAFIAEVGLPYLALDRRAHTLSGGEAQRVRLSAQLGSRLRGVCYVLDEPTIGIHPRDNALLLDALGKLRDAGNTVLVVEHDEETIRRGDYIIDLGPGGGVHGGRLMAAGALEDIRKCPDSLTGRWLGLPERRRIQYPKRVLDSKRELVLQGVTHNNLKNITVRIPVGAFVCVTGVSGAGKSSLVLDTLYPAMRRALGGFHGKAGDHRKLIGAGQFDRVMEVDPSPIGRTPRSTAATYVGFWDEIRSIFAMAPEARVRGYGRDRFSFNLKKGQCPACKGAGRIKVEMSFLPDVFVHCERCNGRRYSESTLEVSYKRKTIADVLTMTVEEGAEFFTAFPKVSCPLRIMCDIGLGYLTLGQPSTTLSGGESQRVKIAYELAKPSDGRTLHPGRANHRPPHGGHPETARGRPEAGGRGEYRGGDRTQPGRDQGSRLHH